MRKIIPVILTAAILVLIFSAATAEDWQNEARGMLTLINEFRTGDNAWYWNRNNRTKTVETGLSGLVYDYQLEEIAKIRATEIVQSFSHTRPDGRKWDTAFPAGNYYKGENLACGYESAADAFEGFREENENYDGQGHRRNMLCRQFTRIGLAAVEVDGTVYWVQEFASGDAVSSALSNAQINWILEDGKYICRNTDGSPVAGWIKDQSSWYYMDQSGVMQTGWVLDHGSWYYMDQNGAMQTGWIQSGGSWYHMGQNGVMQTGWIQSGGNWYHMGQNGVMQTGWIRDCGSWYCLDTSGAMRTGWIKDNNKWYYSDSKGIMQTGWVQDGGKWYHFGKNGMMDTGWIKDKGEWYYCKDSGEMVTGSYTVDGQMEVFDTYGIWQYSEINDYDTPLGASSWILLIRSIRQYFREFLELMSIPGEVL